VKKNWESRRGTRRAAARRLIVAARREKWVDFLPVIVCADYVTCSGARAVNGTDEAHAYSQPWNAGSARDLTIQ